MCLAASLRGTVLLNTCSVPLLKRLVLLCLHLGLYFQFKSTPSKNVSVVGWMVMMADDPEHPDLFLLTDSEKGKQC